MLQCVAETSDTPAIDLTVLCISLSASLLHNKMIQLHDISTSDATGLFSVQRGLN